jgi:hypothetical protein
MDKIKMLKNRGVKENEKNERSKDQMKADNFWCRWLVVGCVGRTRAIK